MKKPLNFVILTWNCQHKLAHLYSSTVSFRNSVEFKVFSSVFLIKSFFTFIILIKKLLQFRKSVKTFEFINWTYTLCFINKYICSTALSQKLSLRSNHIRGTKIHWNTLHKDFQLLDQKIFSAHFMPSLFIFFCDTIIILNLCFSNFTFI